MAVRRCAAWRQTTRCEPSSTDVGDLLAAVRRQAVQHDGVGRGQRRPASSSMVKPREGRQAGRPLLFLAHARPHVGVERGGALGRLARDRRSRCTVPPRPTRSPKACRSASSSRREGVAGRRGDAHLHALEQRRLGQRAAPCCWRRRRRPARGPASGPSASRIVSTSATAWHGWAASREQVDDRDVEAAAARGRPPCAPACRARRPGRTGRGGSSPRCGRRPRRSPACRGRPRSPGCRRGARPGRPPPSRWSCACGPTASRRAAPRPGPPARARVGGVERQLEHVVPGVGVEVVDVEEDWRMRVSSPRRGGRRCRPATAAMRLGRGSPARRRSRRRSPAGAVPPGRRRAAPG